MVQTILLSGIGFGRNLLGAMVRPYETYRRLTDRGSLWELGYIAVLLVVYFATASMVRLSSFQPFLLTRHFVLLISATGCTFLFVTVLFWLVGRLFGGKGTLRAFMLGWGYGLLPTLFWFWTTSMLYLIVPPPRTTSVLGIIFSIIYLIFSAVLLFWKIILSYLTIRFALKLDLVKIIYVSTIVLPIVGLYSLGMYRLGVFRVPFL